MGYYRKVPRIREVLAEYEKELRRGRPQIYMSQEVYVKYADAIEETKNKQNGI